MKEDCKWRCQIQRIVSLVDLMASLSSLEYSSKDSRELIISTTNDDEHSGSKIYKLMR
jgi:hypothetical protein